MGGIGSVAVYSCPVGYTLVGSFKSVCTEDLEWSSLEHTPICRKTYHLLPDEQLGWSFASEKCQQMNEQLATVKDADSFRVIADYIRSHPYQRHHPNGLYVWLGGVYDANVPDRVITWTEALPGWMMTCGCQALRTLYPSTVDTTTDTTKLQWLSVQTHTAETRVFSTTQKTRLFIRYVNTFR